MHKHNYLRIRKRKLFVVPLPATSVTPPFVLKPRYEWTDSYGLVQQYAVRTVPGLAGLDQGSPSLVAAIQHLYLLPPPLADILSLPITAMEGDGQAAMLDQTYFHERKKGGFFIGDWLTFPTPLYRFIRRGGRLQRLDRLQLAALRGAAPVVRPAGGARAQPLCRDCWHREEGLVITHLPGNHAHFPYGGYLYCIGGL